jgi:uncharacterized protein (TIGR00661 family)
MLKILYAASHNENSGLQLTRFLQAMRGTPHVLKISAFRASSPKNVHVDWTLDCLYSIFKPDNISLDNENFDIYYRQVISFAPDLIISDLEYFTSCLAIDRNIPLWQCSSVLINFAIKQDYGVGLFKNYSYLLQKNNSIKTQRLVNIIDNSERKFIYSHLGETQTPPIPKPGFEWIRPYHTLGKDHIPCRHHLVAGMLRNDKKILSLLKRHPDGVAFSRFPHENYPNLQLKDIVEQEEYFCNLRNCRLFVCQGQTGFLADAFYNGKYSLLMPDFEELECVTNSVYSEYLGLATNIYQADLPIDNYLDRNVQVYPKKRIRFLHQKIEAT